MHHHANQDTEYTLVVLMGCASQRYTREGQSVRKLHRKKPDRSSMPRFRLTYADERRDVATRIKSFASTVTPPLASNS